MIGVLYGEPAQVPLKCGERVNMSMVIQFPGCDPREAGNRVVFTGQVGLNKGVFVDAVARELEAIGFGSSLIQSTGALMYAEDPSIPRDEILRVDRGRLRALRRCIMRDVLQRAAGANRLLLSTHASFRWSNGLFAAHDRDHIEALKPTMYLNVVDNCHHVWARLQGHSSAQHTLTDVLIAREIEQFATMALATMVSAKAVPTFIVTRGPNDRRARATAELVSGAQKPKVYPSFPMTLVADMPEVVARIDGFRELLAKHTIVFDPGDVDEKTIVMQAKAAIARGESQVTFEVDRTSYEISTAEVVAAEGLIDRQICDRDYRLIDQSDMIVSLVPETRDGRPSISSGVERELQHAFTTGKNVFVLWEPKRDPSPFITNQVTQWYRSMEALVSGFQARGYIPRS